MEGICGKDMHLIKRRVQNALGTGHWFFHGLSGIYEKEKRYHRSVPAVWLTMDGGFAVGAGIHEGAAQVQSPL